MKQIPQPDELANMPPHVQHWNKVSTQNKQASAKKGNDESLVVSPVKSIAEITNDIMMSAHSSAKKGVDNLMSGQSNPNDFGSLSRKPPTSEANAGTRQDEAEVNEVVNIDDTEFDEEMNQM